MALALYVAPEAAASQPFQAPFSMASPVAAACHHTLLVTSFFPSMEHTHLTPSQLFLPLQPLYCHHLLFGAACLWTTVIVALELLSRVVLGSSCLQQVQLGWVWAVRLGPSPKTVLYHAAPLHLTNPDCHAARTNNFCQHTKSLRLMQICNFMDAAGYKELVNMYITSLGGLVGSMIEGQDHYKPDLQ